MRKLTKAILPITLLVAGIIAVPALYAKGDGGASGSMMSHGMMGDGTNDGGGMMGMMKMMGQMSQMMGHCNNMMTDSRPNDQWRKNAPSESEKKV
ncbi:MAG: hypothetical protein ABIL01_19735 [Pseudomonadota bacterium]